MGSLGVSMVFDTLREIKSTVKNINLAANEFDDECMPSIGKFIKESKFLISLNLSENYISDKGIEILCDSLVGNITLKELNLSNIEGITDKSVPLLMKLVESGYLEIINIEGTLISNKNVFVLQIAINSLRSSPKSIILYDK